ncbi:unnamed protein product [Closterium sp. NIES-64]|nr:unnamed protein product [Closterium sp. NIES-64]
MPPLVLVHPSVPLPIAPPLLPPATCPAGVVCPTGAYCVVDSRGLPFRKCLSGEGIINNGACIGGMSWKMVGTSVVLYNGPSFTNLPAMLAPAVLRSPALNSPVCRVVPKGFNGTVGSLRIMWSVDDSAKDHLVCGKLVFWDKPDYSGSASVFEIHGKWTATKADKFNYATTSVKKAAGVVATGRSFSCLAAVKPPVTDFYATAACPPNSKCSLKNSSYAVCTCDAGTTMVDNGYFVGVVPDVADVAISIYSALNLGGKNPPYVFRLKPNKSVNIPIGVLTSSKSVGMLFRAPRSNLRCTSVIIYDTVNCSGNQISSDVPPGNDVTAVPIL